MGNFCQRDSTSDGPELIGKRYRSEDPRVKARPQLHIENPEKTSQQRYLNNGLVTKTMNEGMLQAKIRQVYAQIDGA